jgi:hypothetical protein
MIRLAAVLGLAVVVGVVWLVGRGNNSSTSIPATTRIVSQDALPALAGSANQPVFWIGPERGARYVFERRSNGQTYIRYLSSQMKSDTTDTLTVGTYPMRNAYVVTLALGKRSGWTRLATGAGGVNAFVNKNYPDSVYLALPGLDYQVEVYDPKPGGAAALVQSGRVIEVQQGERLGLTLAQLEATVAASGKPVYWIGPKPGTIYEYTRSPAGNVYIRYLPKGAAVGTTNSYLTIGTYPMKDAFATTERAAAAAGAVRLALAGATAFYGTAKPTSVYVAFKNADFQIEIYDPVPKRARDLVPAVKPIG